MVLVPLISIRPKWADLIASGRKTVELRKSLPFWVGRMWVYSTSPVQKITGWMDVSTVRHMPLDELWEAVKDLSCVDRQAFDSYYSGKSLGCGAWISKWNPLCKPLSLQDIGLKRPPQSWQWIEEDVVLKAAEIEKIC